MTGAGPFWPRQEWHGAERPCPGEYPAACEACGLWKNASHWGMEPEFDDRPGMEGLPWVVIVGQAPGVKEDEAGRPFWNPRASGGFLRPKLANAPFRWILTNAALCFPGRDPAKGGDKAPTEKQARTCANEHLPSLLERYKPKVIMALGAVAMKAVLGKAAPKGVRAAAGTPWKVAGTDRWVLIAEHPANHKPRDGRDLNPDYERLFATAARISKEGVSRPDIKFTVLSGVREACEWAGRLEPHIWVDIEDNHHKKNPERRSIWHPGTRMLCMSVEDNHQRALLLPPALNDHRVLDAIFRGRSGEGHNFKYDCNTIFATTGFAPEKVMVKRLPDGTKAEVPFDCTLVKIVLPDQGKPGNSLKTVAQREWGCEDWSQPVNECITLANKAISDARKFLRALERRTLKRAEWSTILEASPDPKARKKAERELKKSRAKYPDDFRDDHPVPRPLGSADFGDVPLNILLPYCGQDTYWPRRISQELVPRRAAEGMAYSEVAYRLAMRTIDICMRVERNGLPIDSQRLEDLDFEVGRQIAGGKLALLRHPAVRAATLRTNVVKKEMEKGKPLTGDLLLRACNPQATAMRLEFARECGILDKLPLTKNGNPSVNKAVLKILAGQGDSDDPSSKGRPWEELTEYERLWFVFRQIRNAQDLRSKFLDELRNYNVGGRVRTDFKVVRVEGVSNDAGAESGGGTVTGRLASRNPNLQNLKKDPVLRSLFQAPPGWVFVEADYDRIEPVVLAVVAGVKGWRVIFERGLDLYRVIANDVYKLGISLDGPDDVVNKRLAKGMDKATRDGIKTRLLAIMYDESARSFAAKAGVTVAEVEAFFRDFYRAYPEIRAYKERITRQVLAGEFITTAFGRRRLFPLPRRGKDFDKELSRLIRQALNIPIQSTASDLTIWKTWELQQMIDREFAGDVEIVNLVHDSPWSLCREERALEYARRKMQVLEDMSTLPFPFDIPLRVSVKAGPSMTEAKDDPRRLVEWDRKDLEMAVAA